MWKRERSERIGLEQDLTAPPTATVFSPSQVAAITPSPAPVAVPPIARASAPAPAASPKVSTLGVTLRFKGELVADEEMEIHGYVEGSILHTGKLTLGPQCRIV